MEDVYNTAKDLINLNYVQDVSGNDLDIEIELFQMYFEDTYQRLTMIQDYLSSQNLESIAIELHHLKGSSGNIGSIKITKLVAELEQKYRDMTEPQIQSVVQNIYQMLTELKIILSHHYGKGLFS